MGFLSLSNEDNERRFFRYTSEVQLVISLCQGPRTFKSNIEMVATYCATALCKDRAQVQVQKFLDQHRRLPLKAELFSLLEDDVLTNNLHWSEESLGSSVDKSSDLMSEEIESGWTTDYLA
jgi:hypothetical protein